MTKSPVCLLFWIAVILSGCGREPAKPVIPEARFPVPSEAERPQLDQLDSLLRGPLKGLDLKWAADLGGVAVPELARLAGDSTLSADARDIAFIVLGNALSKTDLCEHPDARNNVVLPVLLNGFADPEPLVRRSAAFAARFVNDARLVAALRPLLDDKDIVQEQAVLALGTTGGEMEVVPIAKLFFQIDNGAFRYSCLYSLAMMNLLHDVDVAQVLRNNDGSFPAGKQQNLESVAGRFVELKAVAGLVNKLASEDVSQRREAREALQKLSLKDIPFDPTGDVQARAKAIEAWKTYLLKDFWRAASPHSS